MQPMVADASITLVPETAKDMPSRHGSIFCEVPA